MELEGRNQTTILLLEDDPVTHETIKGILNRTGYRVAVAPDGPKCLQDVRSLRPDLILMDVPGSCPDGFETCRQLKADPTLSDIPVVIIAAGLNDHMIEAAYESGVSDIVRKPLNQIELLSRINLALSLRQALGKRAEAEMLKGVLESAGNVCHALNQPLQYVLGAVQILLIDLPADDKKFKSLDMIRAKTEQMGCITRKLAAVIRCPTKAGAGE